MYARPNGVRSLRPSSGTVGALRRRQFVREFFGKHTHAKQGKVNLPVGEGRGVAILVGSGVGLLVGPRGPRVGFGVGPPLGPVGLGVGRGEGLGLGLNEGARFGLGAENKKKRGE